MPDPPAVLHPGEVAGHHPHLGLRRAEAEVGGQRLQAGQVPGDEDQLHPGGKEHLGRRAPDALGGAGDHAHPPLEVAGHDRNSSKGPDRPEMRGAPFPCM